MPYTYSYTYTYKVTIQTKYNTITLETTDLTSPELHEILVQPYVTGFRAEMIQPPQNTPVVKKRVITNGDKH